MRNKTVLFILSVLCAALLVSCSVKTVSSDRYCFGTQCSVVLYGNVENPDEIFEGLWQKMTELENKISCKMDYSLVSAINRGEAKPDDEIAGLIEKADGFTALTDGAFSVHIGGVSDLWSIGNGDARVPSEEEIEQALCNEKLDFGAIGKGYASDLARQFLSEHGVESAIINFGGNICCLGDKQGKPFVIGIQNPSGERGTFTSTVEAKDCYVITSGNYERFSEIDGTVYCHILDGRTGQALKADKFYGVTVIGPSGLICDALSTSCFILGEEGSRTLLEHFPEYKVLF